MTETKGTCCRCGVQFFRTRRGRARVYCTPRCRRAAQRERSRSKLAEPSVPSGRPNAMAVAEEIQVVASRLLEAQYGARDLRQLLELSTQLLRDVEDFQSAVVDDARGAGTHWREVAEAARLSEATARSRWNASRVKRRLEQRASRGIAMPGSLPDQGRGGLDAASAGSGMGGRSEPVARAGGRLAAALSFLHRRSGLLVQDAASAAGLSSSYLSRILAGERLPPWPAVERLGRVYNGDSRDLRLLWEAAHGMTPAPRSSVPAAVDRLQAALRGLHLAAGSPAYEDLVEVAGGGLSLETVEELLHGQGVPWWPDTSRLVSCLGGLPGDIRPLWQALHYSVLASCGLFPDLGDDGPESDQSQTPAR